MVLMITSRHGRGHTVVLGRRPTPSLDPVISRIRPSNPRVSSPIFIRRLFQLPPASIAQKRIIEPLFDRTVNRVGGVAIGIERSVTFCTIYFVKVLFSLEIGNVHIILGEVAIYFFSQSCLHNISSSFSLEMLVRNLF